MNREYTEFEDTGYTAEVLERVRKTTVPSLDELSTVMDGLGFSRSYGDDGDQLEPNSFYKSREIVVGETIFNGVRKTSTETLTLQFTATGETGDIDGDLCSEIDVCAFDSRGNTFFRDILYARPEDMQKWTEIYLSTLK
jgi:hypothetical protein